MSFNQDPIPMKVGDKWFLELDGVVEFPTRQAAQDALDERRRHPYRCLFQGCMRLGVDMGCGRGFRFCKRHYANAAKVLNREGVMV